MLQRFREKPVYQDISFDQLDSEKSLAWNSSSMNLLPFFLFLFHNSLSPGSKRYPDGEVEINLEWSTWSPCSRSCGGGLRRREKLEQESETEICNDTSCPENSAPCEDTGCKDAFNGFGKCVDMKSKFWREMDKLDDNVDPIFEKCSACDCVCMKQKEFTCHNGVTIPWDKVCIMLFVER